MYKEYSSKLLERNIKNMRKVSPIPSENLANYVIDEVLSMPKYNFLKSTYSVSLSNLIKSKDLLSEEEKRFVFKTDSEIDFVIYKESDKMPVLLVEVDGFGFHSDDNAIRRDTLKNNILNKYGIKYIRWATNGSGEKEDLIYNLDKIIDDTDK